MIETDVSMHLAQLSRFVKRLSWREFNLHLYKRIKWQANYMNTLARRESDYIKCWFQILNTQHFIDKAVKFACEFLEYTDTCKEIVSRYWGKRNMHNTFATEQNINPGVSITSFDGTCRWLLLQSSHCRFPSSFFP